MGFQIIFYYCYCDPQITSLTQKFLPSKEKTYSNLVVRSTDFEYVFVYLDALNFYDFVLVFLVSTWTDFML